MRVGLSVVMNRIAVLLVVFAAACSRPSVVVKRPADPDIDHAVTRMWASEVKRVARDGDWILTRSYYLVGDAIAAATPGESLSHASIYDAERGSVIEAVGSGVREIPLPTASRKGQTPTRSECNRAVSVR